MIDHIEDYWWAYFAGLVCGEGCLNVDLNKAPKARFYLEMTDKEVVEDVGNRLGLNVQMRSAPRQDRWAQCYIIGTGKADTIAVILEKIIPFLLGNKRRQAQLLYRFLQLKKASAPKLELLYLTRELRKYSGGDNREARERLDTMIEELEHAKMQTI